MALKQEDIQKVGEKLLKHGQTEWEISSDLQLVGMASGAFQIQDASGGKIELKDLNEKQEKVIREELSLGEKSHDFDTNPLIPSDTLSDVLRDQKRSGKKSEFDTNPLIPD